MGRNEVHLRGGQAADPKGHGHGPGRPFALGVGGSQVVGVYAGTIAQDFCIDLGASGQGPVQGLQEELNGTLAQVQTGTIPAEGSTLAAIHRLEAGKAGVGGAAETFGPPGQG